MLKSITAPDGNMMVWLNAHEGLFNKLGAVFFVAGYLLSVIAGLFFEESGFVVLVLVLLGLAVGLSNVTHAEITPYLVAAIALIIIGSNQVFTPLNLVLDGLGETLNLIVRMMAIFTAPAALIQAIRAGMHLARPGEARNG